MADNSRWYDRQAMISKLLTNAAILVLLGSLGFGGYEAYRTEYSNGVYLAVAGTAMAAVILGFSAIIDLLIVNAVALHDLKNKK